MDKNTIIGLVLIGAILLIMPRFLPKPQPKTVQTAQQEQNTDVNTNPQATDRTDVPARQIALPVTPVENVALVIADADTMIIETDVYIATITNVGGGTVLGWQLKEHLFGDKTLGIPVNLIPSVCSGNLGIKLEESNIDLSRKIFDKTIDRSYVENGIETREVQFTYSLENGGQVVRTFQFINGTYSFGMDISFPGLSPEDYFVLWNDGVEPTEIQSKGSERYLEVYAMQSGEMLKTKEKPTGFTEGYTDWVAVRNKYFMAGIIPGSSNKGTGAALQGFKTKRLDDNGKSFNWKKLKMQLGMRGSGKIDHFLVYLGPLDLHILKDMKVNLEKIMNFGWFLIRPISIAFFYVLQFLYGILGNYGWSIIIFSIMIKVILYPLTRKSYESMQAMQALQPKMEALKTKFKDDPQKMNQETMKLYKKHGVNPMGGCLPMILQMPVLFALFNLFRTTIMLRQAEFLGGLIPDLSAPDGIIGGTIHLLPILMGITMILQQRLTMKDPKQKAMAYMMPIMFSFIFYKMASGLNLYYLMFNLLTIAQELLIKKKKSTEIVE